MPGLRPDDCSFVALLFIGSNIFFSLFSVLAFGLSFIRRFVRSLLSRHVRRVAILVFCLTVCGADVGFSFMTAIDSPGSFLCADEHCDIPDDPLNTVAQCRLFLAQASAIEIAVVLTLIGAVVFLFRNGTRDSTPIPPTLPGQSYSSNLVKGCIEVIKIWSISFTTTCALSLILWPISTSKFRSILDFLEVPAYTAFSPIAVAFLGISSKYWGEFFIAITCWLCLAYIITFVFIPRDIIRAHLHPFLDRLLLLSSVALHTICGMLFYLMLVHPLR